MIVDELLPDAARGFPARQLLDAGDRGVDDGSREVLQLTKTAAPQTFAITPRTAKSLKLFELKKAEDPSPFPALTQLEAWGTEAP